MPVFSRSDGELVTRLAPVRTIMPYLMKGRNESLVFLEQTFDVSRTLPWLAAWNAKRPADQHTSLFDLFLWACARALHARPGLNRFVSGGRIYQRKDVSITFVAKREMRDDSPFVTLKHEFPEGEALADMVKRVRRSVVEGRAGHERPADKETALITRLPGFLIRLIVWLARWLDRHNLLPAALVRNDPMYASLFVANIGSVGLDAPFHHLYEYGTITLFGVMGRIKKTPMLNEQGHYEARDGLVVRWTFDERVNDGLYCAGALKLAQDAIEDPGKMIRFAETSEPPANTTG